MNPQRLFLASCLSLVVTAMHFAIRGDVMGAWEKDFTLSKEQLGWVATGGFWGFTGAMIIGGPLCDFLGMRTIMWFAFIGHLLGALLAIFAPDLGGMSAISSTLLLYIAVWIIGFANGFVEAAVNPLIATIYSTEKTRKLNILHAWFPGGIVIGGLGCYAITQMMGLGANNVAGATATLGWKIKIALALLPTLIYGVLLLGQKFPKTERVQAGVSTGTMFKEAFAPLFIVLWLCMWMTAASELGPGQWIPNLITTMAGLAGILVLVYINGLMALLRFFGSALAHKLSPVGLLWCCSILTAGGMFLLSQVNESANKGMMVLAAATIFSVGLAFYWPTMLGITSERFPRGGALLMAIMGGTGMLSAGYVVPQMGKINDYYTLKDLEQRNPALVAMAKTHPDGVAVLAKLTDEKQKADVTAARLVGASMTFRWVTVLPLALLVLYGLIYLRDKARGGYKAVHLEGKPAT